MFTKHFWKSYATDYVRFYLIFGLGIAVFLILTVIMGQVPWFFVLGYTLMDPFSYYMTDYQTVLRRDAFRISRRIPFDKSP